MLVIGGGYIGLELGTVFAKLGSELIVVEMMDQLLPGFDPDVVEQVFRLIDRAEWKRRQYPMGTKISFRAFGRDRRLPVTNGWREQVPGATPTIPPAAETPTPEASDEVVIDEHGEVDANALHDLLHEAKDRAAAEEENRPGR